MRTKRRAQCARLTPGQIDAVFEAAAHQQDYVLGLYALVIPEFDRVERVNGHVACSEETWHLICEKAIAFDKIHHPDVMPGGAWLNWGFHCDESLRRDQIALPPVTYKAVGS